MKQPNAANQPKQKDRAGGRRDPASVLAASTFSAGILLLPSRLQRDARRLYHVLRTIDDLVDDSDPRAEERVQAIEAWARGHETKTPEVAKLRTLARQYPLSRRAFLDFCEGMRHDLAGEEVMTDADLRRYCEQAGGSVGVMLACLLGTSHPDGEEKMRTLGTAMQHTNILRDIDEDYEHGRLYIPQSTIRLYGAPRPGAREQLLRREIAQADLLYEQAHGAIEMLVDGQQAMALSAALYRDILRQIERGGFGRKAGSVKVPEWRKAVIVAEHLRPRPQSAHGARAHKSSSRSLPPTKPNQ
jgi:phytoene synthase